MSVQLGRKCSHCSSVKPCILRDGLGFGIRLIVNVKKPGLSAEPSPFCCWVKGLWLRKGPTKSKDSP